MALYTFTFTIPKNTLPPNYYRKTIYIKKGVITKIRIVVPFGHMGKAKMQIWKGEIPILPENPEEWVYGNNEIIEDEPYWEIEGLKEEFQLVGYNESTSYDHTFIVRFVVVPREVLSPWITSTKAIKTIKELLEEKKL